MGVETLGSKEGEFVLETSGSDIRRVLRIKGVDTRRTTTNHLVDVLETFGIEAAREAIIQEINLVFQYFNIQVNH